MKWVLLISIVFNSYLYSQGIYFSEPTSNHVDYIYSDGLGPIAYNFYHANDIYVYHYYAKLTYPDGSQSNWMEGETGGWWVSKAGTYQIQGKAWVQSIFGGSAYWAYRNAFSFSVVDNYAPANPTNLSVSTPGGGGGVFVHPVIAWNANSEADLSGYTVYRKRDNESWITIATVTTNSYTDTDVIGPNLNQLFTYRVNAFDINGNFSGYSNEDYLYGYKINKKGAGEENINHPPDEFSLSQNYPNPFNPSTNISFSLPQKSFTSLKVYDILGKEIKVLVNDLLSEGSYSFDFNGNNLPSGLYIYQLSTDMGILSRKMVLTK